MTEPPDDPAVAELRAFADRLGPLLASLRGRTLTVAERSSLHSIAATLTELRTAVVFDLEDDDGAAVRRALGHGGEGRA